ncbi:MAG: PolC-type DNA polymerase III, partial [Fervidobacterium sp.]
MIQTFDVVKDFGKIASKLGINARGTLKKVIYDKRRETITFIVEDLDGDINTIRNSLRQFIGANVQIVDEEMLISDVNLGVNNFEDITRAKNIKNDYIEYLNKGNTEELKRLVYQQLNGSGKYIEKVEIQSGTLRIYAIGEFAKQQVINKLKKIKSHLPFKEYVVEVIPSNDLEDKTLKMPEKTLDTFQKRLKNAEDIISKPNIIEGEQNREIKEGKESKDKEGRSEQSLQSLQSVQSVQLTEPVEREKNEHINKEDELDLKDIKDLTKNIYAPSQISDSIAVKNLKKRIKVYGKVFKIDKVNDNVVNVYITDKKDSIILKAFNSKVNLVEEKVVNGSWYIFTGSTQMDKNDVPFLKVENLTEIPSLDRGDNAPQKRIELHAHTKMSDLDSVMDIAEYIKTVKKWGWEAAAVTDHGNVQSIPEFYEIAKSEGIKPIFGVELYTANDPKKIMINEIEGILDDATYVIIDLETTGLNPRSDEIMEIGAVKAKNGEILDEFHTFVKPSKLNKKSLEITGITEEMLEAAPSIQEVIPNLLEFVKDSVIVAHNADFDVAFLKNTFAKYNTDFNPPYIDTLRLSQALLRNKLKSFSLDKLVDYFELGTFQHHRALDDAKVTVYVFWKLIELAKKKSISTFEKLNRLVENIDPLTKHPKHITVLVQNKAGLKNLYKLISKSHTETFFLVPQVLKSDLEKKREGLLIGTGCSNSEIFELALEKDRAALTEAIKFYDYIEIMPLDTLNYNEFTYEEAKEAYKLLYEVGKELNIPVVMVSNAHFIDPEDLKARKVLLAPQSNVEDREANYYLRTTEEMLAAAREIYENDTIAYEIVIENPKKIVEKIEVIQPLEKKLHPPKIEGADEKLRVMAYEQAYKLYGEPLPELVEKRIERELNSIIGHGYAVLYMIAHLIVKKAKEDGYVVGSRGSVGSSLVAHLVGITEVNPLPAHYRCPDCKYFEIHEEYGSGYDLPDKRCPKCGAKLEKVGQDIPFEVFMGFEGDKAPDIDLNFSGEYQERAHKYIEELFGKSKVFRAGTISTIADRSAIGYVKSYMEDKDGNIVNHLNSAEQERLAVYVTGVKRTTGQHPGGLMIVPSEFDVHDFTPYQHPANDKKSGVYTTHFAYESIHDDLVKLDALGHDDPTMIRLLYEYSGIDPMSIPMDDKKTMRIFSSVDVLGLDPDELGVDVGTIGIPEFGTDFVMGMLKETRPKTFAELVRISGLSHGTDVWLGNAQTLIKKKIATLSEVISCRDDIMIYLIHKGLPPSTAFKIMENVRKGKGLKD